uniref:Uncharacterized protein n=1 Tax=Favella ehrenbergii TaxID=182087 RepID=A0A7S3MLC3_9SPIT|mmetsp:Transcript_28968/g.35893  ORF Transcript_28968/g.35893 Transcript_28968/m.35893 type:complete len:224 (+) Transcript_28968:1669-2340(+)
MLLVAIIRQAAKQMLDAELVLVFVWVCQLLKALNHLIQLNAKLLFQLVKLDELLLLHLALLINQLVFEEEEAVLLHAALQLLSLWLVQARLVVNIMLLQLDIALQNLSGLADFLNFGVEQLDLLPEELCDLLVAIENDCGPISKLLCALGGGLRALSIPLLLLLLTGVSRLILLHFRLCMLLIVLGRGRFSQSFFFVLFSGFFGCCSTLLLAALCAFWPAACI